MSMDAGTGLPAELSIGEVECAAETAGNLSTEVEG